jgi:peptide deformylase
MAEDHHAPEPIVDPVREAALDDVRQYGDPVLHSPARPVSRFDEALRRLLARMERTMIDSRGVGVAAPQIGIPRRLLVYRVDDDSPVHAMANPVILDRGEVTEPFTEGCLSVGRASVWLDVVRPRAITVRFQDADGVDQERAFEGFEARVLQHEIDHLEGTVIVDRVSADDRRRALRALGRSGGL